MVFVAYGEEFLPFLTPAEDFSFMTNVIERARRERAS